MRPQALVAESEAAVSTRMQREIAEVSRQVHAKAERVQVERMVDTLQQRVDAARRVHGTLVAQAADLA